MRKSLGQYVPLVLERWWAVTVFIVGDGLGIFTTISGQAIGLPSWAWFTIGVSALVLAQFLAFNKVRMQRDEALGSQRNSVSTKIIVVSNYEYEFQQEGDALKLRLSPEIHAIPAVRVEDIQLQMKGKRYDTDWKPMTEAISGDIGEFVYVDMPRSLKPGKYQARLIAIVDNEEYFSANFTVEYLGHPGFSVYTNT